MALSNGVPVFVETSDALPIVDVELVCREGAVLDAGGLAGSTRLVAQLLRRGPRGMSTEAFDEAVEGLGATLSAGVSSHTLRFHGSVIRRNLAPFLALLGRLVTRPGLRADDLARLKRKTEAELVELRDHDRSLAARAFRRHLFREHPYGLPVSGTIESVRALTQRELKASFERLFVAGDVVLGLAGDVRADELAPMLEPAFAALPAGPVPRVKLREPRQRKGRRVLVVDKPQRTQTQVYLGTLAARIAQPDYHALLVANTAFGGTFTSRVVQEVRVERGWSYGVGSKLGADRKREAWTLWSHPSATQVLDCLALELELLDAWVDRGLDPEEVERAKSHLVKSHAFDLETPAKRLEPHLDTALYDLPLDWHPRFAEYVAAVTVETANAAVRANLTPADLSVVVVATATDELMRGLAALPGVVEVDRVDYLDV
jgi:zinc protease